jgi:hypothetical protein
MSSIKCPISFSGYIQAIKVLIYQISSSKYVFQVERYNKPSIYVDLYPHQSLAELHNRVKENMEYNNKLHDLFVMKDDEEDPGILSIRADPNKTLLELVEFIPDYFESAYCSPIRKIIKLYVIDECWLQTKSEKSCVIEMTQIKDEIPGPSHTIVDVFGR